MALFRLSACAALVVLIGCGGKTESVDGDIVVSDDSALSGPEGPASSSEADDEERGDDGCKDGDHDGHKHHRHHWFKVLDRLDGQKDKAITIANLPAGMPEGLLKKLHRIDRNGDGVVTKKEAKKAWHHKHRDHDDDDGEHEDGERDDD